MNEAVPGARRTDATLSRTASRLAAGRLLDIQLLDHVVIASGGYVSVRDRGVLFDPQIPRVSS